MAGVIHFPRAARDDAERAWRLYQDAIEPLSNPLGAWREQEEREVVVNAFVQGEAQLIMLRPDVRQEGQVRLGWLHVRTTAHAVELWQLFLLPEHRGRGVGRRVLRRLQAYARDVNRPILLAVLRNNPARRLYERVGFTVNAEGPHHLFMGWH